mmetsp:Transcript_8047/g.24869  ORF Transcript_8047/g.24869 Transcript_8047/m.24869 type:complete len:250 (+) Transcript_8047:490-1239(+)
MKYIDESTRASCPAPSSGGLAARRWCSSPGASCATWTGVEPRAPSPSPRRASRTALSCGSSGPCARNTPRPTSRTGTPSAARTTPRESSRVTASRRSTSPASTASSAPSKLAPIASSASPWTSTTLSTTSPSKPRPLFPATQRRRCPRQIRPRPPQLCRRPAFGRDALETSAPRLLRMTKPLRCGEHQPRRFRPARPPAASPSLPPPLATLSTRRRASFIPADWNPLKSRRDGTTQHLSKRRVAPCLRY